MNLTGEYTDYDGGFVPPCAIDPRIVAAFGIAPGEESTFFSADFIEARPFGSLRDDFKVSTPELDALVETAREAGALEPRSPARASAVTP